MAADPKEAVRLYRQGLTLRQVGKALGCSHEWARKMLIAERIPLRGHANGLAPALDDLCVEVFGEIEDEFPDGASVALLTDWLGEGPDAIIAALRALTANGWLDPVPGGFRPMRGAA